MCIYSTLKMVNIQREKILMNDQFFFTLSSKIYNDIKFFIDVTDM